MPIVLQPPFVTMLVVATALLAHFFLGPWQTVLHEPVLGTALVAFGSSFMMWARIRFTTRNTTLFVGRAATHLVCDGPFRFSRNPMYVGVISSLAGVALWFGTLPIFLAVPVAFAFLNFFHVPHEERMLRRIFGDRYLAYSKEVRRWL